MYEKYSHGSVQVYNLVLCCGLAPSNFCYFTLPSLTYFVWIIYFRIPLFYLLGLWFCLFYILMTVLSITIFTINNRGFFIYIFPSCWPLCFWNQRRKEHKNVITSPWLLPFNHIIISCQSCYELVQMKEIKRQNYTWLLKINFTRINLGISIISIK